MESEARRFSGVHVVGGRCHRLRLLPDVCNELELAGLNSAGRVLGRGLGVGFSTPATVRGGDGKAGRAS
jgi:hypothetical protein